MQVLVDAPPPFGAVGYIIDHACIGHIHWHSSFTKIGAQLALAKFPLRYLMCWMFRYRPCHIGGIAHAWLGPVAIEIRVDDLHHCQFVERIINELVDGTYIGFRVS
jgi:hypothetical protein